MRENKERRGERKNGRISSVSGIRRKEIPNLVIVNLEHLNIYVIGDGLFPLL